jgi:RHS repeat-associated protein
MKACHAKFGTNVVTVGDPVDVVTGANLFRQTDFVLAGPLPLPWYRWYDSSRNWAPRGHGWGHAHDYERRLAVDLDGFRYHGPTGDPVTFPPLEKNGGEFAGGGYRLARVNSRTFVLSEFGQPSATFEVSDGRPFAVLTALVSDGHRVELRYDKDGCLHTVTDSKGRPIRVEHDEAGRVARLTLPGPAGKPRRLAEYQYDSAGNLVRVTDPYNHTLRYAYDAENRVVRGVDRRGYAFGFAYDAAGRCVRSGGEDGTDEVRLEYAPEHNATLVTRHDGGQWLYFYEDGVVTRIVSPDGGVRRFVKDEAGRVTAEIDPLGHVTRRVFGADGAVLGKVDPAGTFRDEDDEDSGPPPHRVPENPAEWDLGDLLAGDMLGPPEPDDHTAAPLDPAVAAFLEARSPASQSGPVREEDDFGVLIRETFPDGTSRRWVHDANGNVTRYTDREGRVTTSEYASWNKLVAETDANGGRVRYEESPVWEVAAVTDAGGTRSEFEYDLEDRLIVVRRHGGVRETYQYDPAGNLVGKRDAAGNDLLRFEIGPINLPVVCRLASGGTHTFAYGPRGHVVSAAADGLTVAFDYEESDERTSDQRDGLGVVHQLGPHSTVETAVLGRFPVKYYWLSDDELEISDPTGARHTIRALGRGLVERLQSNGSKEVSRYGEEGRCLGRVQTRPGTPRVWARVYRYSPEGDLLAAEDTVRGTTRYRYDSAHRLIGLHPPDGPDEPIDLDPAGNLLRMPGLVGVALADGNRLREANGDLFEYDRRNHISARTGPRGTTRYHYNGQDMLVRLERAGQPDWTAAYDPLGRRAWKAWGDGHKVEYFWDTDRLAAERDETGRVRVYVYADSFAMVPLMFVDYSSGDANPAEGVRYHVFTDQIGTPLSVEDEDGRVVWSARIDPYGRAAIDAASTIEFNLRFPGHFFDPETGLHYNRFRYYDPAIGRYLQSDPADIDGGLNLYGYSTSPLTRVDVLGLEARGCGGGRPRKSRKKGRERTPKELQNAADSIHGKLPPGKARNRRTTTVTQSRDKNGKIVHTVTSSNGPLTRAQRKEAQRIFGKKVVIHEEKRPRAPRNPEPQDPGKDASAKEKRKHQEDKKKWNKKSDKEKKQEKKEYEEKKEEHEKAKEERKEGARNHGEQQGIAATPGHTDRTQASSSGAKHGGAACAHCEKAMKGKSENVTGAQSDTPDGTRQDGGPPRDKWEEQDKKDEAAKKKAAKKNK